MRGNSLTLTVLIFASAATAQELQRVLPPDSSSQLRPNELCTVEGVVVKATTGEPIKKLTVSMHGLNGRPQESSATTDAAGRFVIQGVVPGTYILQGGGNGYPYQVYGQRGKDHSPDRLSLVAGDHKRDIVFRLQPGAVITGAVSDEDGDPVVGAFVQVLRVAPRRTSQSGSLAGGAQTNDRGEYRIYGLEPGRYYVVVADQGQRAPSDDVYLPTFYPSTPDPDQAAPVDVQAGDELPEVNVGLVRARGVKVRGRVVDEVSGKPFPGIYVQLMRRDPKFARLPFAHYGAGIQDDKGNFEIRGVPPGNYALAANWGDGERTYSGHLPLEVGNADIEGVTLALGPAFELSGVIRIDPPEARLEFSKLGLWLEPSENSMIGGAGAEIKSDGTFVLRGVYEGDYHLRVGGFPEEFYVKSARLGGLDVLGSGLSVSRSMALGKLEIELSLNGGRIDGTVLNAQTPVPGALVTLVPDPPHRSRDDMFSTKTTDAMGRFSLLGLPPGDFKLFAWESPDQADVRDPDFLRPYESHGTAVHIEEKKQQTVQLELIRAEE